MHKNIKGDGRDDWALDLEPDALINCAYGQRVVVILYRVRPRYLEVTGISCLSLINTWLSCITHNGRLCDSQDPLLHKECLAAGLIVKTIPCATPGRQLRGIDGVTHHSVFFWSGCNG